MFQFNSLVEYKILVHEKWQERSVYFASHGQMCNWLSDDWVEMSKNRPALIKAVVVDQPIDYPDIDPVDVVGYEAPTGDMYFSIDVKQENISYAKVNA